MALTVVAGGGGDFKQIEPGTYVARCYRIIDLGTQENEWQGEVSFKKQILIQWEFPTELIEDGEYAGKPFSLSKFYTASLHENAKLREHLESWRSRAFTPAELLGFDLKNILGVPCMISVVKNDKGKSIIHNVSAVPKGMECPAQVNPSSTFDITDFSGFDELTDGIKGIIMKSEEYKARGQVEQVMGSDVPPPTDDDMIPF